MTKHEKKRYISSVCYVLKNQFSQSQMAEVIVRCPATMPSVEVNKVVAMKIRHFQRL